MKNLRSWLYIFKWSTKNSSERRISWPGHYGKSIYQVLLEHSHTLVYITLNQQSWLAWHCLSPKALKYDLFFKKKKNKNPCGRPSWLTENLHSERSIWRVKRQKKREKETQAKLKCVFTLYPTKSQQTGPALQSNREESQAVRCHLIPTLLGTHLLDLKTFQTRISVNVRFLQLYAVEADGTRGPGVPKQHTHYMLLTYGCPSEAAGRRAWDSQLGGHPAVEVLGWKSLSLLLFWLGPTLGWAWDLSEVLSLLSGKWDMPTNQRSMLSLNF